MTGINFFTAELVAKRLELLRELVPAAARVAVLVNPADAPNTESTLTDVEAAARAIGAANPSAQGQHQPRDQCGIRNLRARAARRAVRRPGALLHQPARAVGPAGGAPRDPRDIYSVREFAEAGGLMSYGASLTGCVASGRRLRRPHPQGREAGRLAGRAADQVRAGHQPPDRQDARPRQCRRRCSPRADEVIE